MDIISDTSSQTVVTSLANVTGGYNPFATSNELVNGLATKQDTLTANTNLLGVGSSISALDYGKITLNVPTYFPTSWANVASKPTDFQANWNTTVTNKPSVFPPDMTYIYNKTDCDAKFAILANDNTFAGDVIINGTTKRLIFGSRTEDFLIYLWGTVYGLGVNGSTFRLNAPADASYKFYTGPTNNTMTLNNAGVLSTTGGIALTGAAKFSGDGSLITAINYNNITNNALSFQTPLSKNVANQVSINLTAYQPIINTYTITGGTGGSFGFATGTLTLGMPTTYTALSIASLTSATSIFYKGAEISSSYLKLDGTNTMTGALNINTTVGGQLLKITNTNPVTNVVIGLFNNSTSSGFLGIGGTNEGGNYTNNIFLESTNSIIFNTGSTGASGNVPKMIIMSAGNIGIGTTNALQKLHIRGATPTAMVRVETDNIAVGQTAGIEFGIPSYTSVQSAKITSTNFTGDKSDLKFYTRNGTALNAYNYMTLSSGGDLTIGGVNGVNLATTENRITANGSTLCSVFSGDTILSSYWGVAVNINLGGSGDNPSDAGNTKITGTSSFTINTRSSTLSSGFDKTLFTVRNSGNVGIGTTNPLQKLHIQGATPTAMIRVETNNSTPGETTGIEFGIPAFTSVQSAKITSTSISGDKSDLKFYTRNGTASNSSNYMTLTSSGNLILDNQLTDIRIQLWDGYGFGINDSTLRYNSGTYHRFYNNSVFSATIYNKGILLSSVDATTGGTKGIFFRDGYDVANNNNYNCSILAYDHNGDSFCDGLSINGFDGISFCTGANTRQERMRITQAGTVIMNYGLTVNSTLSLPTNMWHRSSDTIDRVYYANNGTTFFHSGNTNGDGFIFRNTAQSDIVTINDTGNITITGSLNTNTIRYKNYIQPLFLSYSFIANGNPTNFSILRKANNCIITIGINQTYGTFLATNIAVNTTYAPAYMYNASLSGFIPYFTTATTNYTTCWIYNAINVTVYVTEQWWD